MKSIEDLKKIMKQQRIEIDEKLRASGMKKSWLEKVGE